MTQVSISTFRNNLTMYLRMVRYEGKTVRVVDEKVGEVMAELNPPKKKTKKKIHPSTQAFLDMAGIIKGTGKKENISGTIDEVLYGK